MSTLRTIGRDALSMLAVQGRGPLKTEDGELVLRVAQSFLLSLPGRMISGRLTQVRISAAYTAGEDEQLYNADPEDDQIVVTQPEAIEDADSEYADDDGYRPVRNGAVSRVAGPVPRTFVYVAYLGSWKELSNLTLNSENPLGPDHDEGLAALLAVRLAPHFRVSTPAEVVALAERGGAAIRSAFRKTDYNIPVDDALLTLTGDDAFEFHSH